MLRVLGKRSSINVRKVLWACDEIGLVYVQEDWGTSERPTSAPDFVALSAKRLVPVLVDEGVILTESNTIVRYLAAKHGRTDLLPTEPLARARVEEAMDWQATELNGSWRIAFLALVRGHRAAWSEAQVSRSLAEWTAMLRLLDDRLSAGGPYVCGGSFTAADIVIGLSVNRWLQAPIERPSLAAVEQYFERIRQRPASAPHIGPGTD